MDYPVVVQLALEAVVVSPLAPAAAGLVPVVAAELVPEEVVAFPEPVVAELVLKVVAFLDPAALELVPEAAVFVHIRGWFAYQAKVVCLVRLPWSPLL